MMPPNKSTRLVATVLVTLLAPAMSLHAQTPPAASDNEPQTLQEVVVTGTLLRSPDAKSANPVTVLGSDEIQQTGANSMIDALSRVTLLQVPTVLAGNQSQFGRLGDGGFVSLRNLGGNRTLVLVNNRRIAPSRSGAGSIGFDVNSVPLSMVDHIDVLRDGASMVYGSDAIAGVINVVTKQSFNGIEARVGGGVADAGDRGASSVSLVGGKDFDRGGVILGLDWGRSNKATYGNRPRYQTAVTGVGFDSAGNSIVTASGNKVNVGGITYSSGFGAVPQFTCTATSVCGAYNPATDNTQIFPQVDLAPEQRSASANLLSHYNLTSNVTAYLEGTFVRGEVNSNTGPGIMGSNFVGMIIPGGPSGNPFIPANVAAANPAPPSPPGFPPQQPSIRMLRYGVEQGDQEIQTVGKTYRAAAGFKGGLFDDRFHWDLSYTWGENLDEITFVHQTNTQKLSQALSPAACTANAAAGCVLINPFGPGTIPANAISYFDLTDTEETIYTMRGLSASIDGEIFSLPAGQVTAALGADYRREAGAFTPDAFMLAGTSSASGGASTPTSGKFNVTEVYTEVGVPLLRDLPFVKSLTFDGGARYSDYNTFDNHTTWKAGLNWAVNDDLRFRGTQSTGFRAPNIVELFTPPASGLLFFPDPCSMNPFGQRSNPVVDANCTAAGVPAPGLPPGSPITTVQGGNPDLQPETSKNTSVGFVLTPRKIPSLEITADYYRIALSGTIASLDPGTVLNQCYQFNQLCSHVVRSPTTHAITSLLINQTNLGSTRTDGIDLHARYRLKLSDMGFSDSGTITIDSQSTYVLNFLQQNLPGQASIQFAGKIQPQGPSFASTPRIKSNLSLSYSRADWTAGWTTRMIGQMSVLNTNESFPFSSVPKVFYHDVFAQAKIHDVGLTLGVQNLFNRQAPLYFNPNGGSLSNGVGSYDFSTYDSIGRAFYAKAVVNF